jgi:hypothetical protein
LRLSGVVLVIIKSDHRVVLVAGNDPVTDDPDCASILAADLTAANYIYLHDSLNQSLSYDFISHPVRVAHAAVRLPWNVDRDDISPKSWFGEGAV